MITKLLRSFDALIQLIREISLFVFFVVGLAIVGLSIGCAFLIPIKFIAILFASIGAIIGTVIACLVFVKLSQLKSEAEAYKLAEAVNQKADLEKKINEVRVLADERAKLEREVQRLASMRIDAHSYQSILKLGLLKVDASIKDFYTKKLHGEEPGKRILNLPTTRGEIHEYVGVMQSSFTAHLGIDLHKLRFRADESGDIVVSGLESEFQGFLNLKEEWMLKEVRINKHSGALPNEYQIYPNDSRVADLTIEQRRSLQERLNNGFEFRNLDAGIKQLARKALELFLSPIGKKLVFQELEDQNGQGLIDFIEAHNRQIEENMKRLRPEGQKQIAN